MARFWKSKKDMARETPKPAEGDEAAAADATPTQRPGTSGTENLLVNNRREASRTFKEAAKAEKVYKAKKRSATARANYSEAKDHYREAAKHLKVGLKLTFGVIRSSRYVISEKMNNREAGAAEKKKAKNLEKRRKLEEKLAREKAGDSVAAAEGGDAEEAAA